MAVGVSCAGSGARAAMDLLSPLLTDAVDFVRQGALIATSLVLMQQPEAKVCTRDAAAACMHALPQPSAHAAAGGHGVHARRCCMHAAVQCWVHAQRHACWAWAALLQSACKCFLQAL
jgi:hypothetical protein